MHLVRHVHVEICSDHRCACTHVSQAADRPSSLPAVLSCRRTQYVQYLRLSPSYLPSYTAAALASSRHILIPVLLAVPCLGPTVSHWFAAHCRLVSFCSFTVFTVDATLLSRSQYSEGPAIGHLDTGFSWFPCVYKQMLRWFPRLQVATTFFSCSPPDLNLLVTNFIFCIHVK